mgnify:CR=1 FL=1
MHNTTQTLIRQLTDYMPFNEQEERDRDLILSSLRANPESIFLRSSCMAHMTASGWVISPDARYVLMAYHRIYDAWSWLGGHADGNADLLEVARSEVLEESGLGTVTTISASPFSLECLTVDGHEKHGAYVSSHLHLNVTYLFAADPASPLQVKADEHLAVKWFPREEAAAASSEKWFRERIYAKLNAKLDGFMRQKTFSDAWN